MLLSGFVYNLASDILVLRVIIWNFLCKFVRSKSRGGNPNVINLTVKFKI